MKIKKRLSYKIIALVLIYPLVKCYEKRSKGVDGHLFQFFGENSTIIQINNTKTNTV